MWFMSPALSDTKPGQIGKELKWETRHPGYKFHSFRKQLHIAIQSSGDFEAVWPLAPSLCSQGGWRSFLHWGTVTIPLRENSALPNAEKKSTPGSVGVTLFHEPAAKKKKKRQTGPEACVAVFKCLVKSDLQRLLLNLKHISLCVFSAYKLYLRRLWWISSCLSVRNTFPLPTGVGWGARSMNQ